MRLRWGHGGSSYGRRENCQCGPCVVAVIRYHARKDGIVDPVAVDRLMRGDRVWATHAEIAAAATSLIARGVTYPTVAERLGQSERNIPRLLADHHRAVQHTPSTGELNQ